MTDEAMAEEYVYNKAHKGYFDLVIFGKAYFSENSMKQAFLAGFKAGRKTEKEYVKNNAFTSMKEQGLFPFDKWHKVADGDLPKDGRIVSDQEGNNVKYVKHLNKWFYRHRSCEADVIAWCEIPKYMVK